MRVLLLFLISFSFSFHATSADKRHTTFSSYPIFFIILLRMCVLVVVSSSGECIVNLLVIILMNTTRNIHLQQKCEEHVFLRKNFLSLIDEIVVINFRYSFHDKY